MVSSRLEMVDAGFKRRHDDLTAAVGRTKEVIFTSTEQSTDARPAVTPTRDGPSTDAAFTNFRSLMAERGLRDALAYVVGLSEYRFIGIFRFENGMANAAVHFDRENPEQLSAQEVPDTATYCSFIRNSKGSFATAHAARDPRLDGHVAREVVAAYCGVPVMTPEGEVLGTLCHYDLVPRDADRLNLELLLRVASAIEQSGQIPPYPHA